MKKMDLFLRAKSIRLMTYKDRYLVAEEDRISISHGCDGSAKNAVWIVEFVAGKDSIRLKSCYGTYLTALSTPFVPGVTGKKVIQTWPCQCDSATEWEPLRDGMQVRLRSVYGYFLRPNGGLPPWRNSVTHDIPHRSKTREKVLWGVEVVEKCSDGSAAQQQPLVIRSSLFTESVDLKKQRLLANNHRDERFSNAKYCCWYPKACVPF